MSIFWIIYGLGSVATLCLLYHELDKGYVVELQELVLAVIISLFSWFAFFIILLFIYGDKEVFKKR